MTDSRQSREMRRAVRIKRPGEPVSSITTSLRNMSDQSGYSKTTQEPSFEVPRKKSEVMDGSAKSRGPNGYDAGCTKDSLFGGGGNRPIPEGLRQLAAGGDAGGDGDGDSGGAGGSPGSGGNGGDDEDGDHEDNSIQEQLLNPSAHASPLNVEPELVQSAEAELEKGDVNAASALMRRILHIAGNDRVRTSSITRAFLRSGRLDSHDQAVNF